jgi:hypothetical protein
MSTAIGDGIAKFTAIRIAFTRQRLRSLLHCSDWHRQRFRSLSLQRLASLLHYSDSDRYYTTAIDIATTRYKATATATSGPFTFLRQYPLEARQSLRHRPGTHSSADNHRAPSPCRTSKLVESEAQAQAKASENDSRTESRYRRCNASPCGRRVVAPKVQKPSRRHS